VSRPKAVLFDLGKVLVEFDWSIAARNISRRSRFSAVELLAFMQASPLLPRYELGQVTSLDFFAQVKPAIGYRGSFEEFADEFGAIFEEIPEMIELQRRVRSAGIPTYIFSNTNDFAVTHIRRHFPFFANFDGYFLSYELGVMKPDAGIYEAAEKTTGCRGAEILYLDDHPPNVAAGAARGWQAIQHLSPAQTIAQVESILRRVDSVSTAP
jgi:HAD superfamily hydrolase (TIGR01509 family)